MSSWPHRWGATRDEHDREFRADTVVRGPAVRMTRAVTVAAPARLMFRWVCQLSVAPYSYDLIDNGGRQSPRTLTPGADAVRTGQQVLGMFEVTGVRPGTELTLRGLPRAARLFGDLAMTYVVEPRPGSTSRLLCRLVTAAPGPVARARAELLAWGDLVMMRKQLRTLQGLAERDARTGRPAVDPG